ncbi:2-phospho-L-lactate guanylyltransferase [Nocardioides panacisoli]|uniref:2-phospho-L-lactate guanylyltransferase n=1 Tax=Nocardioides panacisoli TaxID=627624 RepID=UPI001C630785|nr:2-phospho-L-lactate guanylyltransferase [Nocardioides panacisoli]QYJ04544.1 2-phospho-L-lactate guanylyltransferase [Nocardioides panacisoli]
MSPAHVAIVPVKPPGVGKSRLVSVPDDQRGRLAVAFATDTLRACLAARRVAAVLVVTDDAGLAEYAASLGATVTDEPGTGEGLNGALRHGAAVAARRWPQLRPFALCADLPALLPDELDAALGGLSDAPGFVADAHGTGTTMYSASTSDFAPHFGAHSADAHRVSGAVPVSGSLVGLRLDVDDAEDLASAVTHGVGAATRNALRMLPGPR